MQEILKLRNVGFTYSTTAVLTDVNISVNPGESIGIIGPNGGGKTTLLKLIMGFIKPSTGSIEVFGQPPGQALQPIAYVPQSLRFDRQFPISVIELVLTGRLNRLPWHGQYRKEDRDKAIKALEKVEIAHLKDQAFGTLSGGQMQRALIARALVSDPQLLLLDEPTANVDIKAEGDIYRLIQQLQGNLTILMVTHHLQAAIEYVQRVICVQGTAINLSRKEVCEHFAMGLYHPPLIQIGGV